MKPSRVAAVAAILALALSSCRDPVTEPGPPSTVEISPAIDSLRVGQSQRFEAAVLDPAGRTSVPAAVSWQSSHPEVVTIDADGLARALAPGTALIVATAGGQVGSRLLVVPTPTVASVVVAPVTVMEGLRARVRFSTLDAEGTALIGRPATFSFADPSIARVHNLATHEILGVRDGSTTISVTSEGRTGTAEVTVLPARVVELRVTPNVAQVMVGEHRRLYALPVLETGLTAARPVSWESENPDIVTVQHDGTILAHRPGEAAVRAETEGVLRRVPVHALPDPALHFEQVVAGARVCGISADGRAHCWGGDGSQTGQGIGMLATFAPLEVVVPNTYSLFPVPSAAQYRFRTIDTTGAMCGLTLEDRLVCWGIASPPRPLADDLRFASITVAAGDICGLDFDGGAHCLNFNAPDHVVAVAPDLRFSRLAMRSHACGIAQDGFAWCWGRGNRIILGTGPAGPEPPNTPVPVAGGIRFSEIAVGTNATCAISIDQELFCWGYAMGPGGADVSVPTQLAPGVRFASISMGTYHRCALTPEGRAYCWGYSSDGSLGHGTPGTPMHVFTPTPVESPLHFRTLSAGDRVTCGMSVDGVAYCWGRNVHGIVGQVTPDLVYPRPVPVMGQAHMAGNR